MADEELNLAGASFSFLSLPRELRDLCYEEYCKAGPILKGPLEGGTEIPLAALRVNKQLRRELLPIFISNLKHLLQRPNIYVNLGANPANGHVRYGGWKSYERCFHLWIRDGPRDVKYAAWWCETRTLFPLSNLRASVHDPWWPVVLEFRRVLYELLELDETKAHDHIKLRLAHRMVEQAIMTTRVLAVTEKSEVE